MESPNNDGSNKGEEVIPNSSSDASPMDAKRLRRLVMNRQYARTFRQKQKDKFHGLIRNRADEKVKLANLNPQADLLRGQYQALRNENVAIRYQINQMGMHSLVGNQVLERLKLEKQELILDVEVKRLIKFN